MAITTYIPSFNDVRALLGVSIKELKDATIGLPVYEFQLESKLDDLHPVIVDKYAELLAKKQAAEEHPDDPAYPPLTKTERKMVGATQVYSAYQTAMLLVISLPIFAAKRLTDGKAEGERVTTAFDNIKAELQSALDSIGDELLGILEDLGETVEIPSPTYFLGVAELGTDPVTGA